MDHSCPPRSADGRGDAIAGWAAGRGREPGPPNAANSVAIGCAEGCALGVGGNAVRMRIMNAGTGHRPFGKRSKAGRHFARRVAAGSNARLLACVLAVGAGLVGATSAWAQAPDGSGSTHRAASEANTRAQTLSSPRGLRLGVDLTAGRPFLRGDAAVIWDRIGSVGIVEGFGVRLGYDFGRL